MNKAKSSVVLAQLRPKTVPTIESIEQTKNNVFIQAKKSLVALHPGAYVFA